MAQRLLRGLTGMGVPFQCISQRTVLITHPATRASRGMSSVALDTPARFYTEDHVWVEAILSDSADAVTHHTVRCGMSTHLSLTLGTVQPNSKVVVSTGDIVQRGHAIAHVFFNREIPNSPVDTVATKGKVLPSPICGIVTRVRPEVALTNEGWLVEVRSEDLAGATLPAGLMNATSYDKLVKKNTLNPFAILAVIGLFAAWLLIPDYLAEKEAIEKGRKKWERKERRRLKREQLEASGKGTCT